MIKWIDINDEMPEFYSNVIIAHRPKDKDDESWGISSASLQYNSQKGDYWLIDENLRGEWYDEDNDEITHWFPLLDELNYPNSYYE